MANDDQKEKNCQMEYRMLGNTGLSVSVLGFGAMSFNNLKQTKSLMKAAREADINFFDNAELYGEPCGNGEILMGQAYAELQKENPALWRRTDLVFTTKIFFGCGDGKQPNIPDRKYGQNEKGVSRKHLMEGIDQSLKRLQLEYVDVIYAHRFDGVTPMKEIVEGFTSIIRSGKAFYWGTSMWSAQKLTEAYWIAQCYNLIPPVVEQPVYNLFARQYVELEYLPMYKQPYQIGMTTWSPLDGGILTGKYQKEIPKDSRIGGDRLNKWFGGYFEMTKGFKLKKVDALMKLAKELGTNVINLSIAWCLKNPNVSVLLLGASKPQQIVANIAALEVYKKLDDDAMAKIEKILENKPTPDARIGSAR